MLKNIFFLISLLFISTFLSSCASVNYAPGKAYMDSHSKVYLDTDPDVSVS